MAVTASYDQNRTAPARDLGAMLDFASRSHARAIAILLLTALINFLPGFFTIAPIDRDEARFAQASKQMIETGDYVDIRFQDEVRYKKPVGIYWLQAGAVTAARALGAEHALTTIWLYRIPSLVGAIGGVLLTYWAALAFVSRRAALLAGLMMASAILLAVEARLATTDAMLLASIVAAMAVLARVYLPEQRKLLDGAARWALPAIFWTAIAAGVLLKGPLIVMVVGLAAASLTVIDRSARWLLSLKPLLGLLWCAALVLPWFVAIISRSHDAFFANSVGGDLLPKLYSAQESHGAPPGLYFVLFWLTFWPGATLAALATPAVWAARREPGAEIPARLARSVLDRARARGDQAAALRDAALPRHRDPDCRHRRIAHAVAQQMAGAGAVVVVRGADAARHCRHRCRDRDRTPAWPVRLAICWRRDGARPRRLAALRQRWGGAVAAARGRFSLLLGFALFGIVMPALEPLFPSPMLARVLRDSGCAQPQAAAVGYQEPSLVFLAGTATRLTDGADAADFLAGGECRFALVEQRQQRGFVEHAEAIGLRYAPGPRIDGINISDGQSIAVGVFRSEGPL